MKKIIILFICLTSSIWHVCAQTKVSGIVKDAQGMEMIGATVLQKGTNNGIVTGLDGKFTLTLSNKAEQTLLISMIGFIEQSIAIKKNHPFINITLEVVPLQKRSKTFSVFIPRIVLTNHCCTKSFHILIQI